MAEAGDLKSLKCGFDSRPGHQSSPRSNRLERSHSAGGVDDHEEMDPGCAIAFQILDVFQEKFDAGFKCAWAVILRKSVQPIGGNLNFELGHHTSGLGLAF